MARYLRHLCLVACVAARRPTPLRATCVRGGADDFDDPLRFVAVGGGGGARAKKKRLKKKGRGK